MCVLAKAHDDDAADHFTFAIKFRDTAPQLRSQADLRDIFQQYRDAAFIHPEWNVFQIVQRIDIAGCAHHVFGFSQFNHGPPDFLVAALNGVAYVFQRQVVGTQLVRVQHHLVLLDHAADGGHLGHAGHGLQFVF